MAKPRPAVPPPSRDLCRNSTVPLTVVNSPPTAMGAASNGAAMFAANQSTKKRMSSAAPVMPTTLTPVQELGIGGLKNSGVDPIATHLMAEMRSSEKWFQKISKGTPSQNLPRELPKEARGTRGREIDVDARPSPPFDKQIWRR